MKRFTLATISAFAICVFFIGMTAPAALAADEEPRTGKQINWQEYLNSALLVGSMAAAISWVDHCSKKPLLIEEWRRSDTRRDLVFTCDGTEDEEGSAILIIEKLGDDDWMPTGYSYAG